jgi:formylglycine-generating enzyme required for sulfatase activity/serine/threonine protein phosphatase PrpC
MSPSKLTPEVWPVTSTGQPGVENQDAVLIYQPTDPTEATYAGSLYVVAASQPVGEQGHVASQYAVRKVMDAYYRNPEPDLGLRLREAIAAANADIYAYNQSRPELVKVAVSLTAVAVRGEQLHAGSVGDSRAYLIRETHLQRITSDHTLVQQLLDEGAITHDEARNHPRRDVLLRTLGTQEEVPVDVFDIRLHPDDALIVCTSGLVRAIEDEDIAGIVASKSPQNAAEMLVQSVRAAGSKDNLGVITALLRDGAPPMMVDLPNTWDRRPPSFEDQQTLAMPRTSPSADAGAISAGQTVLNPRIDRDSPAAQTQTSPLPIDRSNPAMQTQSTPRPAQMPDDSWSQQNRPVPAPPYQASVQPAPQPPYQPPPPVDPGYPPPPAYQPGPEQPAYAPPPQQPRPYEQPAYQAPQTYQQPQAYPPQQPGGPQYAPPGYAIDPVTGLPPVPQQGGQGGYGGQPATYAPRIYQPPAQPNVRGGRRGLSIGTFALVGAVAVLLTAVMVVLLLNPFGWELPFAALASAPTPTPTLAPTLPPTTPPPATTEAPAVTAQVTPTVQAPVASVPPGMALIAGGAYTRGVTNEEAQAAVLSCIDEAADNQACLPDYFNDGQPVEQVTISPFYMDITEVTNRAYAACVAANVCTPVKDVQFYNDPAYADHPVTFVTWEQAGTYCQWLGKRLPTEAEWEKAARWDAATQASLTWPWGNSFTSGIANIASSGQNGTRPVGSFANDKSPWGMLDMGGNVAEWTGDWYFKGYANLGTLNPTGPASQPLAQPLRVGRGGSFQSLAAYSRAGMRSDLNPTTAQAFIGFRCAQPVAGATPPTTAPSTGTPGSPTPTGTAGTPTNTPVP